MITRDSIDLQKNEDHVEQCTVDPKFKMQWNGCPFTDQSLKVQSWICNICGLEFWQIDKFLYTVKHYYFRYQMRQPMTSEIKKEDVR